MEEGIRWGGMIDPAWPDAIDEMLAVWKRKIEAETAAAEVLGATVYPLGGTRRMIALPLVGALFDGVYGDPATDRSVIDTQGRLIYVTALCLELWACHEQPIPACMFEDVDALAVVTFLQGEPVAVFEIPSGSWDAVRGTLLSELANEATDYGLWLDVVGEVDDEDDDEDFIDGMFALNLMAEPELRELCGIRSWFAPGYEGWSPEELASTRADESSAAEAA